MSERFHWLTYTEEDLKEISICRFCAYAPDDYAEFFVYPDEECDLCNGKRVTGVGGTQCGVLVNDCTKFKRKENVYEDYLNSDIWKKRKRKFLIDKNLKCEMCGSCMNINVHHTNYSHLGFEDGSELVVLCNKCHKKLHNKDGEKDGAD